VRNKKPSDKEREERKEVVHLGETGVGPKWPTSTPGKDPLSRGKLREEGPR